MLERDECHKCKLVMNCYTFHHMRASCHEGNGDMFVEMDPEHREDLMKNLIVEFFNKQRIIDIYSQAHNTVRQRLADQ